MGLFDNISAQLGDAFVEEFARPMLKGFTQQFVSPPAAPPGITQAEADQAVAGDLIDIKVAFIAWLHGKQAGVPVGK